MSDWIVWGLAIGAVAITFANPGGFVIGAGIALLLLGGRYGLPFIADLIRSRQHGVGRAKASQKAREKVRGGRERVEEARDHVDDEWRERR
ncbi:hypothetical protein [Halorubrum sp. DTA98]|uniref:hypothetical protein n=1 Tax=Halorubrum sp. DTA98 TaxID=3402163 RepID=UPI003AAF9353